MPWVFNPFTGNFDYTTAGGTSDHESLTGLQGGTTGQHVHLTTAEYNNLNSPIAGTYAIPTTSSNFTLSAPNNNKLGIFNTTTTAYPSITLPTSPTDLMRFLFLVPLDVVTYQSFIELVGNGLPINIGSNTGLINVNIWPNQGGQIVEVQYVDAIGAWVAHFSDYLNWMQGLLPWTKVDKSGANIYDLNWTTYAADQVNIPLSASPYSFQHNSDEALRLFRYNTVDGNVTINLDTTPQICRPFSIVNADSNGAGFNIVLAGTGITLLPNDYVTLYVDTSNNFHVLCASRPALMGAVSDSTAIAYAIALG